MGMRQSRVLGGPWPGQRAEDSMCADRKEASQGHACQTSQIRSRISSVHFKSSFSALVIKFLLDRFCVRRCEMVM